MSKQDVVQSHLEVLMAQYLGAEDVTVDDDGDVCVRDGRAGLVAGVKHYRKGDPHICVTALAVRDVDADPGLFEALNGHNARLAHARVWWADRRVIVGGQLHGPSTELPSLACLCAEVTQFVNAHASQLASTYRGRLLFDDEPGEGA